MAPEAQSWNVPRGSGGERDPRPPAGASAEPPERMGSPGLFVSCCARTRTRAGGEPDPTRTDDGAASTDIVPWNSRALTIDWAWARQLVPLNSPRAVTVSWAGSFPGVAAGPLTVRLKVAFARM